MQVDPTFIAPHPAAAVVVNTSAEETPVAAVPAVTAPEANVSVPKSTPADASFFMTVPFKPDGSQTFEILPAETAFMSVATLNTEVPVGNWVDAGWAEGAGLGESDTVPLDCALHARQGVARQVYAACPGPGNISIPHEAGDFVYIIFTDTDNRIARVIQTGALYNPDTTGLIP